ncbi:hypothetical protein EON65_00400 [archaeon]|nr:MAG: hypothetical protein EON65_00400 [archaeon]
MASDIVYLDVGNTIFRTTRSTLVNVDGFFARMLDGERWAESGSRDNPIFVDRGNPYLLFYYRSNLTLHHEYVFVT